MLMASEAPHRLNVETPTPRQLGYRMPAEWEPHAATWLVWPQNSTDWPGKFAAIPWVYADIVRHLSDGERVHMVVNDATVELRARGILKKTGVDLAQVTFHHWPTNRGWTRDSGPIFVKRDGVETPSREFPPRVLPEGEGRLPGSTVPARLATVPGSMAITNWRFNAWAKYDDWQLDDQLPARVAGALHVPAWEATVAYSRPPTIEPGDLSAPHLDFAGSHQTPGSATPGEEGHRSSPSGMLGGEPAGQMRSQELVAASSVLRPLVLEGGSVDVNGQGMMITTEECLLSDVQQRNPGISREDLEMAFHDFLGVDKVIWLNRGIAGDDTHGHVDDIARFVNASTIVAAVEPNTSDENHQPLRENLERLFSATDGHGRPLRIVELPMPAPVVFRGQRLPASYANFYIANGRVLVPTFNDPNDRKALGILADLVPGREVVGIHSRDLIWGLGAIHCMTQQQPA